MRAEIPPWDAMVILITQPRRQSQDRKGDDARVNMPADGITVAVSQTQAFKRLF